MNKDSTNELWAEIWSSCNQLHKVAKLASGNPSLAAWGNCKPKIIFQSKDNQETWYFGNIFLENYYVSLDMTPYDEHK